MKDIGYGKEYKYAHSFSGNFVPDNFLPEELKGTRFYDPGSNAIVPDDAGRIGAGAVAVAQTSSGSRGREIGYVVALVALVGAARRDEGGDGRAEDADLAA